MSFKFNDCVRKRLLQKIPNSEQNAKASIKAAEGWLSETEKNLKAGTYNSAMLSSYLAMFHSAKALLYLDGFREKSHACVARYLEKKYVETGKLEKKWVNILDRYRDLRHNSQYGIIPTIERVDVEDAVKFAGSFVKRMTRLLDEITGNIKADDKKSD